MKYHWEEDRVSMPDRLKIMGALGRFPDSLKVWVYHPEPSRWTFWFCRGWDEGVWVPSGHTYLCTLRTEGRPLSTYVQDLTDEGYRAEKVLASSVEANPRVPGKETQALSLEDQVRLRLSDFERTMSKAEIEEALDTGRLQGLEFLKGQVT